MTFEVIWANSAIRQLRKLDRSVAKRVFNAVGRLKESPHRWLTRIVNSPYYRLRVGDYRIILDIRESELRVLVLKVGHRRSVYR